VVEPQVVRVAVELATTRLTTLLPLQELLTQAEAEEVAVILTLVLTQQQVDQVLLSFATLTALLRLHQRLAHRQLMSLVGTVITSLLRQVQSPSKLQTITAGETR
jgi:hypothetical protein